MKQEIPLSARNALARQTAAGEHPSADLLSGFVEHSLAAGENERVTSHLAACLDCREIVFLASAAAGPEERAAAAQKYAPIAPAPRLRWSRWKWLAPALAALLIVAGVGISRLVPRTQPTVARMASGKWGPVPPQTQAAPATPASPAPQATKRPHPQSQPKRSAPPQSLPINEEPSQALSLPPGPQGGNDLTPTRAEGPSPAANAPAPQQAPDLAAGDSTTSNEVSKAAPAPPLFHARSAQAAGKPTAGQVSDATTLAANAQVQKPMLTTNAAEAKKRFESVQMQRAAMPAAHWRITSDGHLERSVISGDWTRVLGEQPVSFRAVAVVGDQVWAGGNDGALFQSSDGGNQWTQIALTVNGRPERGAVDSIQFDTALQGRVATDSGVTWKTTDGGKTWTKQ